ncbi:MAG TPA: prolyl oligopeptidase family serine peptidase [Gemmatimonadaceae bacterium]|nr:prolyl oligopeptidase family serine peptidase [Gemmatimonadaceae bacterium]
MTSIRPVRRATLLALTFPIFAGAQTTSGALKYPISIKANQVDDYHGVKVADHYRGLEDPDSPQTKAWVQAQNAVTFGYLGAIPERVAIRNRLTQMWNYPRFDAPYKSGGRYFQFQNTGLQNQPVLFVRNGNGPWRVLLDPNTLSADGTVALNASEPSPDGNFVAYATTVSGSDWQEIRIRNVEARRDLPEQLKWVKFSGISWTRDNKGFFYERYDEPKTGNTLTNVNKGHKVYYHRINKPQTSDELVYEQRDQPDWLFDTQVTEDGKFAIITVYQGTDQRTRLYYLFLGDNGKKPNLNVPIVRFIDRFEAEYQFIGNMGDVFLVRTDRTAPKGRVVSIDINNPQPNRWLTVIGEGKDALTDAKVIGNRLVVSYLQNARSSVRFYGMPTDRDLRDLRRPPTGDPRGGISRAPMPERLDTTRRDMARGGVGYPFIRELDLPGIGTVTQITGKPEDDEMFYQFTSYLSPRAVYRVDVDRGRSEPYTTPKLPVDLSRFETKQVFYTSKDGTRVPMFITAKKGTALDGSNPTILYGYGGFNIAETPTFSSANLVWLEMGGIYAVANLRGGGEYGKEWHEAGMLAKKQNVFDDFIAAAEYLIREKYTSTPKLAISGGSNGGLLVGAVLNQRPDLFSAALPAAGVMDMLRFHKFTIGWAWVSDYGSPDEPKQFEVLRAYSPVHNIKPGTRYPAVLITAADHDDRVVPGHSFKYAAALQDAQAGPAPILIRIETKAGHGAGKPVNKLIEEAADKFAFLVKNLNMRVSLL